ncbi:hypothetical protein OS493_012988 [Desmophyllum pertusum]|uniref:Uncharacterized protein n=1 Tax=Desmophyllum pertusum TaxID=174260 RepID=A0A9X0CRW6_9CNID|nr:hypothetical protein OS493_012988 [Desmophyllum pertusum]
MDLGHELDQDPCQQIVYLAKVLVQEQRNLACGQSFVLSKQAIKQLKLLYCLKDAAIVKVLGKQSCGRRRKTSSNGSLGTRCSSQSSVDRDYLSDDIEGRAQPQRVKSRPFNYSAGKTKKSSKKSSWYSPGDSDVTQDMAMKVATVPYSSTPENSRTHSRGCEKRRHHMPLQDIGNDSLNRSAEMMEIDARLNALQKFMKENMP